MNKQQIYFLLANMQPAGSVNGDEKNAALAKRFVEKYPHFANGWNGESYLELSVALNRYALMLSLPHFDQPFQLITKRPILVLRCFMQRFRVRRQLNTQAFWRQFLSAYRIAA